MKKILLKIFNWSVVVGGIAFIGFALALDGFVGDVMKWLLVIGFIIYLSKIV